MNQHALKKPAPNQSNWDMATRFIAACTGMYFSSRELRENYKGRVRFRIDSVSDYVFMARNLRRHFEDYRPLEKIMLYEFLYKGDFRCGRFIKMEQTKRGGYVTLIDTNLGGRL